MKTWLPLLLAVMVGAVVAEGFGAPFAIGLLAAFGVWLQRRQGRLETELRQLRAALQTQGPAAAAPAPAQAQPPRPVLDEAPSPPIRPATAPIAPTPPKDIMAEPVAPAPVLAAEVALASPTLEVPPSPAASAVLGEPDERAVGVTSSLGSTLKTWFTGGNTIVRLAVLILFLGVAFLLRYAAEHSLIPIELRLAGVAAGAVALVLVGWRLRERRRGYGLSLQGAGVGVLYLTLFAALRLYGLLPPVLAFALLVALGAVAALLALRQDALPLAVLGTIGGFLAPVLASTGQGSHVTLFSYYLLLNLGIAFIARHKAWKLLNLVGLTFTFGIGLGWGLSAWRPGLLASTEPFLVAHVALYLWIAVQYALRLAEAPGAAGQPRAAYVDGALLFGMPLAAFGLQAGMVRGIPNALALSAAVLAAVYLLLGRWLWRRLGERLRLVTEGMLALGVVFLALVPPLALDDARWTGIAWALQGAGVAWVALRQQRAWALALGVALQVLALGAFWVQEPPAGSDPFLNAGFAGLVAIAVAALFTALQLYRLGPSAAHWPADGGSFSLRATPGGLRTLHGAMLAGGALHLVAGVLRELTMARWGAWPDGSQSGLLALAALALLFEALHAPLCWPPLSVAARPTLGLGIPLFALGIVMFQFLSAGSWDWWWPWGTAALLAWIAAAAWVLRRLDADPAPDRWRRSTGAEHVAVGWMALAGAALWAHAAMRTLVPRHEAWTAAVVLAGPTALAWAALSALRHGRWPVAAHPGAWLRGWAAPWLALMAAWSVGVNAFAAGGMAPLPYLPLLNPIDLGHALMLLYALRLRRAWQAQGLQAAAPPRGVLVVAALLAFWWLDGLLVRTLHHWAGTPMWFDGALDSGLVQTTLTIAWTLCALAAMFLATRRVPAALARPVWLAGATLLGLTVVKLMLVDLGHTSALQRIVSFLGVGALMLVIGYVSPLPPAGAAAGRRGGAS